MGVFLGGNLQGGQATWVGPLLGSAIGAALGSGVLFGLGPSMGQYGTGMPAAFFIGTGLVLAGGMLGYEMSHHQTLRAKVVPVAAPGTAGVAVAGSF